MSHYWPKQTDSKQSTGHYWACQLRLLANSMIATAIICSSIIAPLPVWGDDLEQQFLNPPDSAKPRVWWHWMNGNVTTAGIEADLRWMKRIGIGGLHTTDAGLKMPIMVDQRVPYRSEAWQKAFEYAAELAESLSLEFGVFTSPGWSLTGGPWVKPEQAMKKMVWSEFRVTGGRRYTGQLPELPLTTGPFQNMAIPKSGLIFHNADEPMERHGAETIVIAYKAPEREKPDEREVLQVTSNAKLLSHHALIDGDIDTSIDLPLPENGKPAEIALEFEKLQEIRSVTVSAGPPGTVVHLASSVDGKSFQNIKTFYMGNVAHSTVAIDPVTARYFRFRIRVPKGALPTWDQTSVQGASNESVKSIFPITPKANHVNVRDLVLRKTPRVHQFETKAAFQIANNYYAIDTLDVPLEFAVPESDVLDLTEYTNNGTIDWEVPPGDWVILRLGYSLQGKMNHAASAEGTGLEVDKLNKSHVADYFTEYLKIYSNILDSLPQDAVKLDSLMMDSYEIGIQNWSEDILSEFQRLRGYDPLPWLPTLTGIVVENARDSDRFLWDFRRTLSDLLLENHYKTAAEVARISGLQLYGEALESARWSNGDDMELRRYTDIPTAAIWMFTPEEGPGAGYVADILGAASVAHIYGQNLVAVEAGTSALAPWAHAPRTLKPVMDKIFSLGGNRPIIHASVHQPSMHEQPGFTLAFFGQNFSRHDTWAEVAGGWMDYLARCSFLLQQGSPVADVAYFYGEEAPLVSLFSTGLPAEVPSGVGFDFVNSDVLLHHLSVQDGMLITPSGMSYQLLYLGGSSSRMTLAVLHKIKDLLAHGAIIVGAMPVSSPSLADDNDEFERLAEQLWAGPVAPGNVMDLSVAEALENLGVERDFDYQVLSGAAELNSIHRRLADGDIYFVSNSSETKASVEARFRVSGREAQIWLPETGQILEASYEIEGEQTIVPLELEPQQSLFVLFRKPSKVSRREVSGYTRSVLKTLNDGWQLTVPTGNAIAETILLDPLGSWSDQTMEAIKYFSGTALYRREIVADDSWFRQAQRLMLNLGDVREMAQVYVNGDLTDTLWSHPYRSDITENLVPGKNIIEVYVTNLWVNRLIGDSQPGAKPIAVTAVPAYTADAPLAPSGILGPVRIERWTSD